MFSPRFVAVFAILATVAAIPASDRPAIPQPITSLYTEDFESPWFTFPLFGKLFAPLWKLFPTFADIGPKIITEDNKFQVVVSVKDYKKDDLKVKIKGDFIFVQGVHEAKQDDHDIFATQFFHTYTLPANSSSSDVSAELSSDGYLIVTAPINGPVDRSKDVDRDVPIVETGKVYKEENVDRPEEPLIPDKSDKPSITTIAPTATTVAALEGNKEPTTSSEQEKVTERDNAIPQENEIQP